MILTWVLTIAGFVLIFVELGAWSAEENPHAILGTITTILCFLQPFAALFRPAPSSSKRPIFNWLHWLVGNIAHILASTYILLIKNDFFLNLEHFFLKKPNQLFFFSVVTIFFAVKLTKAELPSWFDWILVAFVAFHVIVHLVLSVSQLKSKLSDDLIALFV